MLGCFRRDNVGGSAGSQARSSGCERRSAGRPTRTVSVVHVGHYHCQHVTTTHIDIALASYIMGGSVAEWLGAEGPGFKSQLRRCRVTVLGKLFTPIVPLFTKQRNWWQPS